VSLGLCKLTALSVSKSLCPGVNDLDVTDNAMLLVVTTGTLVDDLARNEDVADIFTVTTVALKLWFCEPFTAVTNVDSMLCSEVDS